VKPRRFGRGWTPWPFVVCVAVVLGAACNSVVQQSSSTPTEVFSPAPRSVRQAIDDFFWVQPRIEQPVAFPHDTHVENDIGCTEYCHEGATVGPVAGLPGVETCLICHIAIATDRPIIRQITALEEQGLDLSWVRVNQYPPMAHVRFVHAPHIRAEVDCSTCHGDIAHQTIAQRNVDLDMGFCVTCHESRNAPLECVSCHF
jgi:hypothetical protein